MMITCSVEESGCVFEDAGSIQIQAKTIRQVPAKFRQSSDRTVQTLNACLPWAAGVLGVVAGMVDQCVEAKAKRGGRGNEMK